MPTVSSAPNEQITEPTSEQATSPRPEKQPSYADVRERPTMGCEQPVVVAPVQSRVCFQVIPMEIFEDAISCLKACIRSRAYLLIDQQLWYYLQDFSHVHPV